MRKLFGCTLLIALVAAAGTYGYWTKQREVGHYLSDLRVELAVDDGVNNDQGNLLGIEPELSPRDYQSLALVRLKLEAYLNTARDAGLLNDKTIVVLPEHIGTWLMLRGEKSELYQAANLNEAMRWLALSNPLAFANAWVRADGENRINDAYLRTKAKQMAADYQTLFGGLAKEFGVTLVAGSIALPNPHIVNGKLLAGSGPLYNSSVMFDRNGTPLDPPQRQLLATYDAQRYIQPSQSLQLNVVDTPAGRLGISTAEAGVSVFLHGKFWDKRSAGQGVISRNGQTHQGQPASGARLLNIWL